MGKEDLTETAGDEGGHIGHIVSMDEKGKIYIGLKVPKPPKEYFENLKFEEQMYKKNKSLRDNIAFVFFLLGELNYWIARKIFDKEKVVTL